MTKQEAVDIFGNQTRLAKALGISPQAISQWAVELTDAQADRVVGAAVRLGKLTCGPQADPENESVVAA